MSARAVPILMYHLVSPAPRATFRKYTVTPARFAWQMRWLALNGYGSVTLDQLNSHWRDGTPLPPKPVAITFDDGFHDCMEYAVPVLKARGFTATFFIVAALVGNTSAWLERERGLALRLMDWPAARSLQDAGFACGSHTLTHPRLAELDRAACERELAHSRDLLEEHLGQPVRHLAYPHGSYSPEVARIAAEVGYHTACSSRSGRATADDLLALRRIEVAGTDSVPDFACRLLTGRTWRDWAWQRVDRVRSAP